MFGFSGCFTCCICAYGDGPCFAGNNDDDFMLASKEQIISRLDSGKYPSERDRMINVLEDKYEYRYKEL